MASQELSTIDKLVENESKTNDDGTVQVTIENWEETERGDILVEFVTPSTELKTERMPFPQAGGNMSRFKFYRLVKSAGLEMRNADLLEGEEVTAHILDSDDWRIYAPETTTIGEHLMGYVGWFMAYKWERVIITLFWMAAISGTIILGAGALHAQP